MYNDIRDEIEFTKNVNLHRPKKTIQRNKDLPQKLLRVFYFFLVLFLLFKGGVYVVESYVSFCHGTDHKSMDQIIEEYKEFKKD